MNKLEIKCQYPMAPKGRLNVWDSNAWVSEDRLAVWAGLGLLGGVLVYVWAMSSHLV